MFITGVDERKFSADQARINHFRARVYDTVVGEMQIASSTSGCLNRIHVSQPVRPRNVALRTVKVIGQSRRHRRAANHHIAPCRNMRQLNKAFEDSGALCSACVFCVSLQINNQITTFRLNVYGCERLSYRINHVFGEILAAQTQTYTVTI